MKKIMTMMAAAMLVAAPAFFTSCDDDPWYDHWYGEEEPWWFQYDDGSYNWNNTYYNNGGDNNTSQTTIDEAQVLNGTWSGQMIYTNGDTGEKDQFYARMTFAQNSSDAIKGTGMEYDYYLNQDGSVGNNQTLMFSWYIADNGDIYIKYDSGTTFVMDINASQYGFYLDESTGVFNGYMVGSNNNDMIQFDFTRQTSNAKSSTRAAVSPATTTFGTDNKVKITAIERMSLPKNRR